MDDNPYRPPDTASTRHIATSAKRWLALIPLVIGVYLLLALPLMLSLLALLGCNAVAFLVLLILRQTTAANLAFLSGVLFFGTVLFTDFGLSTPYPRIIVAWGWLVPALISQLALIAYPFWRARTTYEQIQPPPRT